MRDVDRRKLILLAETRSLAATAIVSAQRLLEGLERLDNLEVAKRVTKDLWSALIDIREALSNELSEVPS